MVVEGKENKPEEEEEIPQSLCVDAGLRMPETARSKKKWTHTMIWQRTSLNYFFKTRSCGLRECPRWIASRWGSCRRAKCVAKTSGKGAENNFF